MMSRRRMIMAQSHGGGPAPSIPDNEVWYYAPEQVTLYTSTGVVSHTFADGKGVLTFANPVTTIGKWFRNKNTITDVKMPETVTEIGEYAFAGCTNLALTSLPSGLTSISGWATFENCTNLALTSLPSGLTSISDGAFHNCTNLALTSLPSGITSIGTMTFAGCTNLALTSLPSGVTSIGNSAFSRCTSLIEMSLGGAIAQIDGYAFQQCRNLESFTVNKADPPVLSNDALTYTSINLKIYVPASAVATYKAASNWSTYAYRIFAIPE